DAADGSSRSITGYRERVGKAALDLEDGRESPVVDEPAGCSRLLPRRRHHRVSHEAVGYVIDGVPLLGGYVVREEKEVGAGECCLVLPVINRMGPGIAGRELHVLAQVVVRLYDQRMIAAVDAAEDVRHGAEGTVGPLLSAAAGRRIQAERLKQLAGVAPGSQRTSVKHLIGDATDVVERNVGIHKVHQMAA